MVKFKVAFTITAETMFSMLSKFLPVEDLTVEEMVPKPVSAQPKLARQFVRDTPKLKRKRSPSRTFDLNSGINRIIMELLADGQTHKAIEIKPLLKKAGFSANSVGSRLQALREKGIVEQMGKGAWRAIMNKAMSA